jgi:hypothetical protein
MMVGQEVSFEGTQYQVLAVHTQASLEAEGLPRAAQLLADGRQEIWLKRPRGRVISRLTVLANGHQFLQRMF